MEVYLDHNATTPVAPEVIEAMNPWWRERLANPSSAHLAGRRARNAVTLAREQVASAVGAEAGEVIFTSGGTEACNLALQGVAEMSEPGRALLSRVEHPAVLRVGQSMSERGWQVDFLPVDRYGRLDVEATLSRLTPDVRLVAVMLANNEVGTVNPVSRLGHSLRDTGALFFVDAVQALGKVAIDVNDIGCHLLALSAHKAYGPHGAGALVVRRGVELKPLFHGGGHERGLRSGTLNVPGIVGFGRACQLARERTTADAEHYRRLRAILLRLPRELPATRLNGHPEATLLNTVNLCIRWVDAVTLAANLSRRGVHVATGSACSAGRLEPSHVLRAIGLDDISCHSSIRFSVGRDNTVEQVDYAVQQVKELVPLLRELTAPDDIGQCGPDCPCFFGDEASG